jgi:hypothetical protein
MKIVFAISTSFLFEKFLGGIEKTFTDFLFIVSLFGDRIEHIKIRHQSVIFNTL